MGFSGKGALALLAGMVAAMVWAPGASALTESYTFDSSAQGFSLTGSGISGDPVFSGTGGNPGGNISFTDTDGIGSDAFDDSFVMPSAVSGNLLDNYGGTLSFDLKTSVTGDYPPLVYLERQGGAIFNAQPAGAVSGPTFQTYSIKLAPSGFGGFFGPDRAQLEDLLAHIKDISINTDDFDGPETSTIDNVTLTEGTGPPAPIKVARDLTLHYNTNLHAFVGVLSTSSGNDVPSCTSGRPVKVSKKTKKGSQTVGTQTTDSDGGFILPKPSSKGTYTATAKASKPITLNCLAAKSPAFKIK